jgi:hypothetical protein
MNEIEAIQNKIYEIRGQRVMLDFDLAEMYGVETRALNQAVKRNIERFPEDFMFRLTKEEYYSLKCHFGTSNTRGGDHRALPYAFTQQGIGMLSGLLRSHIAIDTNIRIMRAFVNMRRYLLANSNILQRLDRVEIKQLETKQWMERTDNKISVILDKMEVYFMGASLKDMGAGLCAVTEMQASPETILGLLK